MAKARIIFENVAIQSILNAESISSCQYAPIRFFEVLFIKSGSGSLLINGNRVPYHENQIFVFIPNDSYTFNIDQTTSVIAVKFLNKFLIDSIDDTKSWFHKIETILYSSARTPNIEFNSPKEEQSISALFTVLQNENENIHIKNKSVIKSALHSVLHIITRNIIPDTQLNESSKIQSIIDYIHYNIQHPELLSRQELSKKFHVAPNYIGQYFKKNSGISLKKYILNYKVKLAMTRLKHSNQPVSEIAQDLGFTDTSHLNRIFITYTGQSIKDHKSS